jgi:hypothetical protein
VELRALDAISAASFLDREGLRSPRLRWLLDYACRDDYGLTLAADQRLGAVVLLRVARRPRRR